MSIKKAHVHGRCRIQSGGRLNYRRETTRVGDEAITRTRIISPIDEGSAFLCYDTL